MLPTVKFNFLLTVFIFLSINDCILCSPGDRAIPYLRCVYYCKVNNCTSNENEYVNQPLHLQLLQWDCQDECSYQCMWQSLDKIHRSVHFIPQFHGKWPFIRFLGIQEPASALFSILNAVGNIVMWLKFRSAVPTSSPYYNLWKLHTILSLNAWSCSTIFHTRDTPLTEKLDYFGAFAIVLYNVYCLVVRAFQVVGQREKLALGLPFLGFFLHHIHFLSFVHFDYGYNMRVNLVLGVLNTLGWLAWLGYHQPPRSHRALAAILLVNGLLALELGDFPPWYFVLDAHALWHLGTIPVPYLWYSFLIADCSGQLKKK